MVHPGDHLELDLFRTNRFALADVGTSSEFFGVELRNHAKRSLLALGLALRKQSQMSDLRASKQSSGSVGAGRDAGAASDARGRIHGAIGIFLRHGDRVAIGRASGWHADVSAGFDDAIERAAVHDQILNDWKRL